MRSVGENHARKPAEDHGLERSRTSAVVPAKRALPIRLMGFLAKCIPGDWLRTTLFLNGVARPRKLARYALNRFYRMEHIYEVLAEAKRLYGGNLSILEFGTHHGYALTKMLYATRYMKMEDRVTVHGFDSFKGMPALGEEGDANIAHEGYGWIPGQYRCSFKELDAYCRRHYDNYRLHRGFYEDSLTEKRLSVLKWQKPILVWFDCDFYSSSRTVFERLLPYLPCGCVIYFDEFEWSYGSRFTGESRLVHEINHGEFGDDIELVLDHQLSLDSNRIYRFLRKSGPRYPMREPATIEPGRRRSNDSPLP